ncbi:hypothetical protein SCHPADRAFT_994975 [Schizopora paradoxa]|uniref:BTB domain-containing protein n=1 Tax=Schizopora paradoxa TaxID=27342 RepID=A0A0H2S4V1_9AGAM|nr:hypothetical protein SCHPADRAFT_994975 [Schizopora paradoxa]
MDVDEQHRDEEMTRKPKPHDILWLPDGNVVLATDVYLFRVHKSVLSLHSSVFKSMFELPNVGQPLAEGNTTGNARDTFEGLPLVNLFGDKGEDVEHLLRTVYELRYHDYHGSNTPCDTVIALLILSTKYDFKDVRANVITQISKQYPINLQDYDSVDDENAPLFGMVRDDCHFDLLSAAYKAEAHVLLPTLYLACATFDIRDILAGTRCSAVDPECLQILLEGRDGLVSAIIDCIWSIPEFVRKGIASSGCCQVPSCLEKFRYVRLSHLCTENFSSTRGKSVIAFHLSPTCMLCRSFVESAIEKERETVWKKIPALFKCPSWQVIKENLDEITNS